MICYYFCFIATLMGEETDRAETIPRDTRVTHTKNRGKLCALKNRFVHLLEMHWIFGSRKYMLHRTPQQCSGVPLSLNRHHCAVSRSTISFCIVNHSCSPEKQSPLKYTESPFLLISHWFTRSDVMSINSYYAIISLHEWKTDVRFPLPRVTSQWGHKYMNISRTALRVTSWAFHLSKSVSYPHITEM